MQTDNIDAIRQKPRWFHRLIDVFARVDPIRRLLFNYCEQRSSRSSPVHPFDHQYGVKTSGALPAVVLQPGSVARTSAYFSYLGTQPSIMRQAFSSLPRHTGATFLDMGCGKGRALVVASEFPFRAVVGVELSPELAKVAADNAEVIARNFPDRTSISVVNQNVLDYVFPDGDLVVFLYNPFGEEVIAGLLRNIENILQARDSSVWIVYANPVYGHVLDGSVNLTRVRAESIAYDSAEIGFGPNSSDVVIVWQDAASAVVDASRRVDARILVTESGWHTELVD
jgi:SAM-dependent methyltransferase